MELNKEQILNKLQIQEGPKINYSFQEIGVEMQKVYGKKVWSIFYKHPEGKIREAWKIANQRGILSFGYLLGILNKL